MILFTTAYLRLKLNSKVFFIQAFLVNDDTHAYKENLFKTLFSVRLCI